jgi:hypothetical protein
MSLKDPQQQQKMIEDLAKRVTDLENYVRALQQALAKAGIKAPTL